MYYSMALRICTVLHKHHCPLSVTAKESTKPVEQPSPLSSWDALGTAVYLLSSLIHVSRASHISRILQYMAFCDVALNIMLSRFFFLTTQYLLGHHPFDSQIIFHFCKILYHILLICLLVYGAFVLLLLLDIMNNASSNIHLSNKHVFSVFDYIQDRKN